MSAKSVAQQVATGWSWRRAGEGLFLFSVTALGAFFSLYVIDLIKYQESRAFEHSILPTDFLVAIGLALIVTMWDISNGDEDTRLLKMKKRVGRMFFLGLSSQALIEKVLSGGA